MPNRYQYQVRFVTETGSGGTLEALLEGEAKNGWRVFNLQHNPNGTWYIVFEMLAVATTESTHGRVESPAAVAAPV